MGVYNSATQYAWMQSTYSNSAGTYRALALNPNGGNVGIGTSNPSGGKLHIHGTATPSLHIDANNADSTYGQIYITDMAISD